MQKSLKSNVKLQLNTILNDKALAFPLKLSAVYLLWKILHYFLKNPGYAIHAYWLKIVYWGGVFYAGIVVAFLRIFGESVTQMATGLQFHPSMKIIYVEDHCLAIPASVIFCAAILLQKGSWINKLWFVPVGLLAIMLINVLRLVFVSLSFEYFNQQFFSINHSLVYVVVTYSLIFGMIVWWGKKIRIQ